jgi:hypothetical protein
MDNFFKEHVDSPDPAVLPEYPHHPGRLQERYQANSLSQNVVFTLYTNGLKILLLLLSST